MTRWQLTFSRGEKLKYVGHLDLSHAWLRAMRRASIPLTYSSGFHPHPKMAFAAPLPVGVLGAAELLDLTICSAPSGAELMSLIEPQLPGGLALTRVDPLSGPPLAARVHYADYLVDIEHTSAEEIDRRIEELLAAESLPCERQRERTVKNFDLRPFIVTVTRRSQAADPLHAYRGANQLLMRLVMGNAGAGRPDDMLGALGLRDKASSIERLALILDG